MDIFNGRTAKQWANLAEIRQGIIDAERRKARRIARDLEHQVQQLEHDYDLVEAELKTYLQGAPHDLAA